MRQLAEVALNADRENDVFRGELLAAGERDLEIAALAGDRGDLGIEPQVDLRALDIAGPALDHLLARLLLEGEVAAQRQDFRRRHHVLVLLIFEDRVVEMWCALEQDMRHPLLAACAAALMPAGPDPTMAIM